MRRVVLHPSVFLRWFSADGPDRAMREEYEAGLLRVDVPAVFGAQVLGAVARTRALGHAQLARLADDLARLGFEAGDPPTDELARWLALGLDAGAAPYAALAAAMDVPLTTTDPVLLERASAVAQRP